MKEKAIVDNLNNERVATLDSKDTREIKTLKDIYGNKANGQISVRELKAEAVKWVKHWEAISHHYITPEEFAEFFNLTEEDLK